MTSKTYNDLVELPREPTEVMYEGAGQPGSTFAGYMSFRDFVWCYASMLDAYSLSRLSAPPAEAKPVAWSVKPLEWKKSDPRDRGGYCYTPFGLYRAYHEAAGRWFWGLRPLYGPHIAEGECASETEATAAAEADYEQRALALIVHPDPRAKAAEAVPEGRRTLDEPATVTAAAFLWLRNHYDVGDRRAKRTVLKVADRLLAASPVTSEDYGVFVQSIAETPTLPAAPQPDSTGEVK